MTRFQFVRSRLLAPPPTGMTAAVCCALAVIVPTAIRAAIDGVVSGTTFGAYYPFVLVAAMFLGWQLAVVVSLLSACVANFLFMHPRYEFFAGWSDTSGAVSFLFSSFLLILVAATLRRSVEELEVSRSNEKHLNLELQHRVKNTIAVVQALARQTFRDPASQPEFQKFEGRLTALAGAHDILGNGQWETRCLPSLAKRALEPFNREGLIHFYGPGCILPEESCVPLVLALHELATNAAKYGALSTPSGRVELLWTLSRDEQDGHDLILEWSESNGPSVVLPTRRGLGSRLLRSQAGLADVQLTFAEHGVTCRLLIKRVKPSVV